MHKIERQFEYHESGSPLRLLGVLCIILAPLAMWMTFQEASFGGLFVYGHSWFAYIPAPLVPWAVRLGSLVLVWAGYAMIKGAGQQDKLGGRIAFTANGIIWEAGPPDGVDRETSYQEISNVRVSDKKGQKVLTFTRADNAHCFIKSSQMKSVAEFDEMATMLAERTQLKTALEAQASA